jgi:putative N6-adenine-specific DNA methylase
MTSAADRKTVNPSPRRIKRRVIAPVHEFFAATAPGIEPLCRRELLAPPVSAGNAAVLPGGVGFSGRLVDLYRANLHLRTANRILMRIAEFSAENFRQLHRRLSSVDWELYLPCKAEVRIRVSTRHCRLYHSEAVARRFEDHVQEALGAPPERGAVDQERRIASVFVRGKNDRFVVSVDSSGDLLHRRGIKTHRAAAPLRETLAAAVLMWAGYTPEAALLDPMCGSGTFSLEAALMAGNIPPGWHRRFAFEHWPAFRLPQWKHLRKEAGQRIVVPDTVHIFAGDRDPAVLEKLRGCLDAHGLEQYVALSAGDFFDLRPEKCSAGPGLVVLNPPYGRRLSAEAGDGADMTRMLDHLMRFFSGWKVALVSPPKLFGQIPFPHQIRRLVHGGLGLALVTGRIPDRLCFSVTR